MADKEIVHEFERKKPDFQWEIRNTRSVGCVEENPEILFRFYHIECKRLGSTYFTAEYVRNGICRFINGTHRYGQHVSSGAMIGYVQKMELQALLDKVNSKATLAALPQLSLTSDGWKPIVSRLDHQLDRTEVQPTLFDLRHLWIDLRHHYTNSNMSSKEAESLVPSKPSRQSKPRSRRTTSRKIDQQKQ